MDLQTTIDESYNPNQGATLELLGIDGTPLMNDDGSQMTLSLLGADSDIAVKAGHSQTNRRITQGPRAKITAESMESDGTTLLARMTVGWNITMGGVKPPFSTEDAKKLYANPKLAFIREQADAFVADRKNFLTASSGS